MAKIPSVWLPASHASSTKQRSLIYFICGNPGLIEFYRDFLSYLRGLLDGSDHAAGSNTAYDIYGRNLPGFSDDDHEPFSEENPPWDVGGVVSFMYADVAARRREDGGEYDSVILMGHSVGTFIAVEMVHLHAKEGKTRFPKLSLQHGFLLFPTITHLALSPSGRKFTFLMRWVPFLQRYGHVFAGVLISLIPVTVMMWYLQILKGFTTGAAQTVVGWLKSRDGVRQALWLAGDEMKVIVGEERWGEEMWEAAVEDDGADEAVGKSMAPRFFMFYGKEDHWVANSVRDKFIERMRTREKEGKRGGPRIAVDEGDLPHDFCTKEDSSFEVAKRVSGWVEEVELGKR